MINFEYTRALTVKAATDALARYPAARLIAGGTNLVDLMKKGVTAPARLIDINSLPLKQVEENSRGLSIGALVINSDLSAHEIVLKKHPLLSQAMQAGASAQLRNMATVGGNMMQRTRCTYFYDTAMPCNKRQPGSGCGAIGGYNRMHAIFGTSDKCIAVHPSDMCVALAALDAQVTIAGPKTTRTIAFTDFHRLPGSNPELDNNLKAGEIITGVYIPPHPYTRHVHYLKLRDRASYAFALISVAAALELENNRIKSPRLAMGGVAHKPWRLQEAEAFLQGRQASMSTFKEAGKLAVKEAKGFGENDFKIKMSPVAIAEALHRASQA